MTRDEEIGCVFRETVETLDRNLSKLSLTREEIEAFEENLFTWFNRFLRRPGNERVPPRDFQASVVSGACHMIATLGVPELAKADENQIARRLGLLPEESPEA